MKKEYTFVTQVIGWCIISLMVWGIFAGSVYLQCKILGIHSLEDRMDNLERLLHDAKKEEG